jgi:hypothetical protein
MTWSTTPDKRREAVVAAGPPRHLWHAQSDTVRAAPTSRAAQPNGPLAGRHAGLRHRQLVHGPAPNPRRILGRVTTHGQEGSGPAPQGRVHDMPVRYAGAAGPR